MRSTMLPSAGIDCSNELTMTWRLFRNLETENMNLFRDKHENDQGCFNLPILISCIAYHNIMYTVHTDNMETNCNILDGPHHT